MVTAVKMKNRFFTLAFAVLFIHQLGRFIFSLTDVLDGYKQFQPRSYMNDNTSPEKYDQEFMVTQFSGITSKEEREQRISNNQAACSASKNPKSLKELSVKQKSVLLKHVVVSEKYKFLYCYTPKVACSNWKRVVMVLEGVSDDFVRDHPHGLKYLSEYSNKEIEDKLENYYKFMFVRNPLERLLSAYRNKFGEIEDIMRTYGVKIKKRYRKSTRPEEEYAGKIPGDDVSFEEFVRFLLDHTSLEGMNEHWASMNTLCHPCVMNYDLIGSYDNLYEDSEEILRQIEAPEDLHFPSRQSFYSPTSYSTTAYYYSLVNNTYLRRLFSQYSQDFTLFSYPFPKLDSATAL